MPIDIIFVFFVLKDCMYLHALDSDGASFTKEEMQAGYVYLHSIMAKLRRILDFVRFRDLHVLSFEMILVMQLKMHEGSHYVLTQMIFSTKRKILTVQYR